jgi:flagellar hook-associated protein 2
MSTSGITLNSSATAPISVSGLASGLNTTSIITALMDAQRIPITHLTDEQSKLQGEQAQLQTLQTSLQQLSFAAAEFSLPSLFESTQSISSSEPLRVSATTTNGAGVGGYEVEVTQLANSAQRSFTFASPAAEATVTIEGSEFKLKAGETAKQFAAAVNADGKASVYAAAVGEGTIVLSSRETGSREGEFITVSSSAGTLTEQEGTSRNGKDAEFSIDGVAGTSSTNNVTTAIPGVTLNLLGLTTVAGPVTIDVQAPGVSASAAEAQMQSFVKLYNSTISAIQTQLSTKPVAKPSTSAEYGTGTLYGDQEMIHLLDSMRQAMYEPIEGLPESMASPSDIGVSTGAATASGSSQSSLSGQLTLNTTTLAEAVKTNPEAVQKMLQAWSTKIQGVINDAAEPGGTIEGRSNGDASQITELTSQISNLNELLVQREKALVATYAELESIVSQNDAQSSWLTSQAAALTSSGG